MRLEDNLIFPLIVLISFAIDTLEKILFSVLQLVPGNVL